MSRSRRETRHWQRLSGMSSPAWTVHRSIGTRPNLTRPTLQLRYDDAMILMKLMFARTGSGKPTELAPGKAWLKGPTLQLCVHSREPCPRGTTSISVPTVWRGRGPLRIPACAPIDPFGGLEQLAQTLAHRSPHLASDGCITSMPPSGPHKPPSQIMEAHGHVYCRLGLFLLQ